MKKYIVEQVRGRPKYLHIALNFQSDFPNLIDLCAIFPKDKGHWPQVPKGWKIPGKVIGNDDWAFEVFLSFFLCVLKYREKVQVLTILNRLIPVDSPMAVLNTPSCARLQVAKTGDIEIQISRRYS